MTIQIHNWQYDKYDTELEVWQIKYTIGSMVSMILNYKYDKSNTQLAVW